VLARIGKFRFTANWGVVGGYFYDFGLSRLQIDSVVSFVGGIS